MTESLLRIRDLSIDFPTADGSVRALHGVDLALDRGGAIGIVGESGSGKSITWLGALGLLGPRVRVSGSVQLDGRQILGLDADKLAKVRGRRIAMIFQDATSALNPVLRIGKQLAESLVLHRGMTEQGARAEAARLLDQVHIASPQERLRQYPHELSGGTNQRVMIAMALAGRPDILIADEPTTALDVTTQAQILELLKEIRADLGMALVAISHDLGVISELADHVYVMYAGRCVETAPFDTLFSAPVHPYTRGLVGALPEMWGPRRRLVSISGKLPEPSELPRGCAFGPRCASFEPGRCDAGIPALRALRPDHSVACIRAAAPMPSAPLVLEAVE